LVKADIGPKWKSADVRPRAPSFSDVSARKNAIENEQALFPLRFLALPEFVRMEVGKYSRWTRESS
jgi:hypothetical protein